MPSQKSQSEKKQDEQKKAHEQNEQTKKEGGDPSDNNATPAEDAAASTNESVLRGADTTPPDEDGEDNEKDEPKDSVAAENARKAEPGDENYSPYNDPDVPSSAVAEQIAAELRGEGKSRTLDGIREQKKAAEKK